jgi:hypothetical protein
MNPRRALALVFLLAAAALPVRAQEGYNAKDAKKAQELAAQDRDFKSLGDAEKQKVIEAIALQIHGRRRKATQAMIVTRKGTSVEELEKNAKRTSGYQLVAAEQDKEASSTPARTTLTTNEVASKPLGKLFADNDSEVLDGSPDAEALKTQTDAVLMMLKKTDGRLVSIHVESSASTLKNTGKAAALTHLELSRKRAESAADFVTRRLAASGVTLADDQVTLDYDGANGNGTSGPSSPYPCADPKLCAAGSCDAPPELADAVKKGALDDAFYKKVGEVYDPFKYVLVSFVVVNETASTAPGAETPGEAHAVLVHVGFKEKPEFKFRWPRINIRLPKSHRNWGSTACPRF